MKKNKIKITNKSSFDEIRRAQQIIGLQAEIKAHEKLCKSYKFTHEQTVRQLLFMYGQNYKEAVNAEVIVQ